ncbi:hypothetical protein KFL_001500050 [Klebsormidium nitens]|uniref:Uncharacterized protein n=1 Tax=Klebsormidium nitens TaxID=105231 RepID=A0A1Y1HXV2_KLENI|nr:hypothetical protein KFL_001500050 [Klebsormidium nitens]|eukprot:GAQ83475.1 hypothetical protein KFL_001500050 [Klebsormidium nitens]
MKSPHSESRSEMLLKEGLSRPLWLGDATLEEQIVGTLWGRLAKGLQKDHTGKVQASSAAAVVQEWLLRGGNARALTYAVWCEIVLRTIKASTDGQAPAHSHESSDEDDDMSDDDASEAFHTCRPSVTSDVGVSSQSARGAALKWSVANGTALESGELDAFAVESLRWLHGAWAEYPLEKPDQEADRLRLFAVVKCLGQEALDAEPRGALRTVLEMCPLPALVKLAFADVRERFMGRITGREGQANGDLDVFVEAQAKIGVVSVLQLDRYADVRAGRLEQKKKSAQNVVPLAAAAEQSLRRVDTFPFRAPDPLEVAQLQARVAGAKERGQLYILLSNRLSQGHARASAGLEDGLLVMEWVLDFMEQMLPVCQPEAAVARSICYSVHGVKLAIDTTECREGAEHLIATLDKIERLLADSAVAPERNELALDGRPLSEFEKLNAKYMSNTLTRIDSLPSFLVKKLRLSDNGNPAQAPAAEATDRSSSDDEYMPEVLNPQTPGDDARPIHPSAPAAARASCDGSVTEGDSDSETERPRSLDAAYQGIVARNRDGNGFRAGNGSGNGVVLVSEESLEVANTQSDEPSSPPAWLLRKQRSLGLVPPERTESGLERAWKSTVQIDAGSWEARPLVGLQVKIRRNKSLLEREYLPKASSPSGRALRSRGIAKRPLRSPKKISYLTAAALRGVIKSTEGAPLEEFEGVDFDTDEKAEGGVFRKEKTVAQAFDLETERRAAKIADEMEEDPVTPSFFAARRKGAAVAARLPRSGVRRDWMALKLVRERAAAAAFARRQLAKSQREKERRKAAAEGFVRETSDVSGSFPDGDEQRSNSSMSQYMGDIQPGEWEPTAGGSWPRPSSSSTDSKIRPKRVTFAENCQDRIEDTGRETDAQPNDVGVVDTLC